MAQQEPFAGLTPEDITVDEEGRVIIANPQIAERLKAAMAARLTARPRDNINCLSVCNTVEGCGA